MKKILVATVGGLALLYLSIFLAIDLYSTKSDFTLVKHPPVVNLPKVNRMGVTLDSYRDKINFVVNLPEVPEKPKAITAAPESIDEPETIVLSVLNSLTLRMPVTPFSMSKLQNSIMNLLPHLSSNEPLYLVLDTPGGDIDAGQKFIDMATAVPHKIVTITRFSASMGFHIVQNLGPRYILPHGILMSHHATISGFEGEIPGNGVTRFNNLLRQIDSADMILANRIGITLDSYRDKIKFEYWVTGQDAVTDNAADKVVKIVCDSTLDGTHDETIETPFGNINLTYSNCPAIGDPMGFNLGQGSTESLKDVAVTFAQDKQSFVNKYVLTNWVSKNIR